MADRRRYPRLQAHVFCRPAGLDLFHARLNTRNLSLGGASILSDEDFKPGHRLELEVVLPSGEFLRCWAEVVWVASREADGEARYDVGLRFTDLAESDIQRLAAVLDSGAVK
jgi:c-di-GMP-binding flagellar brake protein YcgR